MQHVYFTVFVSPFPQADKPSTNTSAATDTSSPSLKKKKKKQLDIQTVEQQSLRSANGFTNTQLFVFLSHKKERVSKKKKTWSGFRDLNDSGVCSHSPDRKTRRVQHFLPFFILTKIRKQKQKYPYSNFVSFGFFSFRC